MKHKIKLYFWLFGVNIFISAFTFGGGYVVVPMIRKFFVVKRNIFSEEHLMDMAAVAQSSPGAIAINLSALSGYAAAGFPGLAISCVAAVLPPFAILAVVSKCYNAFASNTVIQAVLKGMQAGVAAVIVDFVIDMVTVVTKERSALLIILMPAVFAGSFFLNINVAFLLIGSCAVCVLKVWIDKKRGRNQ